ncbi:MAG: 4'-phosphopantetheinyl transferase superfamily protein [Sedimenticola sp.]|nr:4'-phosphopantetheinyl transferase superfamily protein [Sedimenticola sp.]
MTHLKTVTWQSPKTFPAMPATGELHLWKIHVEAPGLDLENTLSPDEQLRGRKMLHKKDNIRFSNARGGLRSILGGYLNQSPRSIRFEYGPKGKPFLKHPSSLTFNLTHAGNLALIAISNESEIGIDLERQQQRRNMRKIAQRVFSSEIHNELEKLNEDDFEQLFFLHWTQKEARVKALGESVFTHDSDIARIPCANFVPEPGWCAAIATPDCLADPKDWLNLLFTPDLFHQMR